MKEIREIKTYTYDMGDGYRVDIVADYIKGIYETWLYHTDHGKKTYMFGVGMSSSSFNPLPIKLEYVPDELIKMAETYSYNLREERLC